MLNTYYVGLDIHKKTISFCVRQADGNILEEGILAANSQAISSGDDISVLRRSIFISSRCATANTYSMASFAPLNTKPRLSKSNSPTAACWKRSLKYAALCKVRWCMTRMA
jgi:hypothetical protein